MADSWRFAASTEHLGTPISASHDPVLVVLSILAVGSFAMGAGVWAMHFTAMLANTISTGMSFSTAVTIISVIPALLGSAVALHILQLQLYITRPCWRRSFSLLRKKLQRK